MRWCCGLCSEVAAHLGRQSRPSSRRGCGCSTELTECSIFDHGEDAIESPTIAEALVRGQTHDKTWSLRPDRSTLTAEYPEGNSVTFANPNGWPQLRVEFTDIMNIGWLISEYAACAEID